jgi:threonyl-tRNA synthetase
MAQQVLNRLRDAGLRAEADFGSDKIGYKVREAETQKVPYSLVLGEKEAASGQVAVRQRGRRDLGAMPLEVFLERAKKEILEKR